MSWNDPKNVPEKHSEDLFRECPAVDILKKILIRRSNARIELWNIPKNIPRTGIRGVTFYLIIPAVTIHHTPGGLNNRGLLMLLKDSDPPLL